MAVVLTGDGNLCGKMNGDAELVLSFLIVAEVFQIIHRLVFCQYTEIGSDVILAVDGVAARELVACIEW